VLAKIDALLQARAAGAAAALAPALPYRNFIAQTLAVTPAAHEAWLRAQLGDIEDGTVPFGMLAARVRIAPFQGEQIMRMYAMRNLAAHTKEPVTVEDATRFKTIASSLKTGLELRRILE
jgi:hypothetical protein